MASVTPGSLLKLLQSLSSSDHATPTSSHHRSPILQITAISPATSDLWPSSTGFYLNLSDSIHSSYFFLPDPGAASSLHIGQLVALPSRAALLPSRPVPTLSSLKPIPFLSRSPPPLLGSPQPLSLSFSSSSSSFVILPSDSAPPPVGPTTFQEQHKNHHHHHHHSNHEDDDDNVVVLSVANNPKRRSKSPSPAIIKRDPSPAGPKTRAGSRASSPVPSKCVVPSLVSAKDENRKVAKEPAIVVPSRYRQPSPVAGRRGAAASPVAGRRGAASPVAGRRGAASPVAGRRGSISPGGRRLSIGGEGSGSGGGRKKVGVMVMGVGRGVRKSWEENSNSGEGKEERRSSSKVDQQAILRTQVTALGLDLLK